MAGNDWIKSFDYNANKNQYFTSPSGKQYQALTGDWYMAPEGNILRGKNALMNYEGSPPAGAMDDSILSSSRIGMSGYGTNVPSNAGYNADAYAKPVSAFNAESYKAPAAFDTSSYKPLSQIGGFSSAGQAPVSKFDMSGYSAPSSVGSFQQSTYQPQSFVVGSNPFSQQLEDANKMLKQYMASSAPTLSNANAFGKGMTETEAKINALLSDPSAIQQTAAYKFRLGQGQEALQRQMAAKGMLGSGNRLMELTKYGQDMASQEYGDQVARLQQLYGTQAQGYGSERQANVGAYNAALGAHSARGSTLANLVGSATGAASSAYGQGLQAMTTQRGQDIDWNNAQQQARIAARGQDITQRGQDVGLTQSQMQAALGARGQDVDRLNALLQADVGVRGQNISQRGQDMDLQQARMQAALGARGQDVNWQQAQMQAALGARGQDITQRGQGLDFSTAMRGQDISQRGQDLNYRATLAQLAAKNPAPSYSFSTRMDTSKFNPGGFAGVRDPDLNMLSMVANTYNPDTKQAKYTDWHGNTTWR